MKPYRLPIYSGSCVRTASSYGNPSESKYVNKAQSGKINFEKDFEKSHIKTNFFQKVLLGLGSSMVSITSPYRGDMIAVMGEVTGYQALEYMKTKMTESEEGKRILEEKPRISSSSVDLEKLKSYPQGTLGKAYSNFLEKYGYTPDTRNAVQFVDDIELAYIAQRYRECHDLIHTLLDMPTNMLGEVSVKWVEAIQFKLPMCATGALFGAVRLAPKFSRAYSTKPIIKISSSLAEKIESKEIKPKEHPGVMHLPRTSLPEEISKTAKEILHPRRRELREAGEALRKMMEHRVLATETEDKRRMFREFFEYFKSKVPADREWNEKLEDEIKRKAVKKLKTVVNKWKPFKFDKNMGLTYLMARASPEFAILKRVFNEIIQRDKEFRPESLLDFGSGIGTVTWAAHNFWGDTLNEYYCVDTSADMNELAAMILRKNDVNNEPFIKTVYFRQFFPATPRLFDIVVSSFTFFELNGCEQRLRMLTALWNDTKEYLVLVENGTNWGFQVISEARDFLLNISKEQGVDCHVFAPCPHDMPCPRLYAEGKKTPCNFLVQCKKFSFTQADDTLNANFCYVIFRKKPPPPEMERRCRCVRPVLLRHKHVVCKLCTTEGELETVFVAKSKHGNAAYRCARASKWGDQLPGPLVPRMIESSENRTIADAAAGMMDGSDDRSELISDSDTESDSDSSSESDGESDTDNNTDSTTSDLNKRQRQKYLSTHLPWAVRTGLNSEFLLNVYFENRWDQTVGDLYRELNITPVPSEKRFFSEIKTENPS